MRDPLHKLPGYNSHLQLSTISEVWWTSGRHWDDDTGKPALIEVRPGLLSRVGCAVLFGLGADVLPLPTYREPDPYQYCDPLPWAPAVHIRFAGAERAERYEYATAAAAKAAHDGLLAALRGAAAMELA